MDAERLVRKLSLDPRTVLRGSVRLLQEFDTSDSKRLVAKLEDAGIPGLVRSASRLLESEGTLIMYRDVDLVEVRKDLDILLEIQVLRTDILSWVSENREVLRRTFSPERLDWLWDFSWSYILWGPEYFEPALLELYGAIRGNKPEGLKNIPYQAVLNRIRKEEIRRRQRQLFQAAKKGDIAFLEGFGLNRIQAEAAIRKVQEG